MTTLLYVAAALVLLALMLLAAGQAGLFSGRAPQNLGVRDGHLKPPSRTPNSVSSQADLHAGTAALVDYARIAPIAAGGDAAATLTQIRAVVESMPAARIVEAQPDYLYAQFTTRWLKFVDDVEFWVAPDQGVIHVRSASRLGSSDLGANRARVEQIRARLDRAAHRSQ